MSISSLIESKIKLGIIKEHPLDNIILEVALEGKVEYIISYNNPILNILEFRKVKILNPQDFLKILKMKNQWHLCHGRDNPWCYNLIAFPKQKAFNYLILKMLFVCNWEQNGKE